MFVSVATTSIPSSVCFPSFLSCHTSFSSFYLPLLPSFFFPLLPSHFFSHICQPYSHTSISSTPSSPHLHSPPFPLPASCYLVTPVSLTFPSPRIPSPPFSPYRKFPFPYSIYSFPHFLLFLLAYIQMLLDFFFPPQPLQISPFSPLSRSSFTSNTSLASHSYILPLSTFLSFFSTTLNPLSFHFPLSHSPLFALSYHFSFLSSSSPLILSFSCPLSASFHTSGVLPSRLACLNGLRFTHVVISFTHFF